VPDAASPSGRCCEKVATAYSSCLWVRAIVAMEKPTAQKPCRQYRLKTLFWSELNYDRVNTPLSRRGWDDATAGKLAGDPVLFASGANDFRVPSQ